MTSGTTLTFVPLCPLVTWAVDVADQAQAIGRRGDVALPLAAALEARAHALLHDERRARDALTRAEANLAHLEGEALMPSAFGYNEAQLRFHAGNAHTHLHNTEAAMNAQDQALRLCAPGDYTDQVLTQLDRATCLLHDRDVSSALGTANDALRALDDAQRVGIISARAHELLKDVPADARGLPLARDLVEVLASTR